VLKINIEITEKEGVMTVQTDKKTYVEKRKIVDFDRTRAEGKTVIEQMEDDGMNDEFVEKISEAFDDDFLLHNLMSLCYEWQ
jgi:hypothetical protein